MKRKKSLFCYLAMVLFVLGCATKAKQQITEPPPHSHYYPFTEVMGEYHLRLIVDHYDGNMALVFEDYAERPAKPVYFRSIEGTITFPDGTVKEGKFEGKTKLGNKYSRRYYMQVFGGLPRQRGIFSLEADWIKLTPKFTLEVDLNFKGKDYHLTFEYEVPGGSIKYHRK